MQYIYIINLFIYTYTYIDKRNKMPEQKLANEFIDFWIDIIKSDQTQINSKALNVRFEADGNAVQSVNHSCKLDTARHNEERFFFGLCPVSMKTSNSIDQNSNVLHELKACSGCLSVCYAGKEEQKKHWSRHKFICKPLQYSVKKNPGIHPMGNNTDQYTKLLQQRSKKKELESIIGRDLSYFEYDMITYPRLCMTCLSGAQKDMITCRFCHCAAYCSIDHLEEDKKFHSKSCEKLYTSLTDYIIQKKLLDATSTLDIASLVFRLIQSFVVLPSREPMLENNIEEFFASSLDLFFERAFNEKEHKELSKLYSDIKQTIKNEHEFDSNVRRDKSGSELLRKFLLRHLTFKFTCPLTVLYGAMMADKKKQDDQKAKKENLVDRECLTIHVVGAKTTELEDVTIWEVIPLRLPNLKSMNVVFIGPQLSTSYPSTNIGCVSQYLQKARPEFRDIRYVFIKDTYDSFLEKHEQGNSTYNEFISPDLITILNCGFIFYDSWNASIPHLFKFPNIPVIFTEYHEKDAESNLQKVKALVNKEFDVIIPPTTPNPFCSSLPSRIPTGFAMKKFNNSAAVMSNDYICIVKATEI